MVREISFDQVITSLSNYTQFTMKMVLIRDGDAWYVYRSQILLRKEKIGLDYKELYFKNGVCLLEITGLIDDLREFINGLQDSPFTLKYPPHSIIKSKILRSQEYYISSQDAVSFGLDRPFLEIRIGLEKVLHPSMKLPEYRSVNELIREKTGMDLDRYDGLRDSISLIFLNKHGSIKNVEYSPNTQNIKADINFMEGEKFKYLLKLFVDYQNGESVSKELELKKTINEHVHPLTNFELRLIYKDIIVDNYKKYVSLEMQEDGESNLELYISELKEKVNSIKKEIKMENFQIGEIVENRLKDAEEKLFEDPRDSIQAMGEAIDFACADYCNLFKVQTRKTGLEQQDKMAQHWKNKSGKNWIDLKYQTGSRHVIRICSLKKHENYEPFIEEAVYLLLLSWRGYWEILRMIKDVQEKETN